MSVSGRIEDFSIVDILQYLHTIQKSGVLHVQGLQDEAQVFFHSGQVVRASMPGMTNLGDVLVRTKGVKLESIVQAAAHQRSMEAKQPLGAILVEKGFISKQMLRDAVLFQIQDVIYRLVGWNTGEFNFEVQESLAHDDISVSLQDLVLPEEVNTEFLLLEAVRKFDEDRNEGKKAEEDSEAKPLVLFASSGADGDCLVQDLKQFAFQSMLTFSVREFTETLEKQCDLGREPFALVVTSSNLEFEKLLEGLAVSIEANPGLVTIVLGRDLDPVSVMKFYEVGGRLFIPLLAGGPCEKGSQALTSALRRSVQELIEESTSSEGSEVEHLSEMKMSFSLLQMMLKEGGQLDKSQSITLQFLNILSEHIDRAVLFLVSSHELRGIGGFGRNSEGKPLNEESKNLRIPFTNKDLPRKCVSDGECFSGTLPREMWAQALLKKIGIPKSKKAILLPVMGVESALCLVYGDNGNTEEPIRHVELLEVAAGQTGIIIENAFLRKQKKKLEAEKHA